MDGDRLFIISDIAIAGGGEGGLDADGDDFVALHGESARFIQREPELRFIGDIMIRRQDDHQ
ncbi:hypothetical protein D3C75_1192760 [compost metagenome]